MAATVSNAQEFQIPQLPDPGKADDIIDPLDFNVRLGSTLARGAESVLKRKVENFKDVAPRPRRQLSQTKLQVSARGVGIHGVSPRSPLDAAEQVPGNGGNSSRHRKESRRHSNAKLLSTTNVYVSTKETAKMRVQRIFKAIRIISGVCLALKRYVQACETKSWSFMEMYLHVKKDINMILAFNPNTFARVEPERLKLKKLLDMPGNKRTPADVNVILALLRDNTSFQDYPYHVQHQLAYCMTYQSYEARRVVIKQGHRPEAFYILLSGFVMANIEDTSKETGKQFVKTVKEVGPGETFGEVALIEGGRRTATIVCKTNVELLVILKEDFDSIIREPLVKQIDEHVNFCKTMALFQDFPCDKLAENPSQFFYHFFKKGDTVVKDSRLSKYIIVVKAGTCRVVCDYTEEHKTTGPPMSSRPDMRAAFPHYQDMEKIRAMHRKPKNEAERLKETICLGLLTGQIDRTRLADHGPDVQRPKSSITPLDTEKIPPLKARSNTLSSYYDNTSRMRKENIVTDHDLMEDTQSQFWDKRLRYSPKKPATAAGGRYNSARSSISRRRSRNPFYSEEKTVRAQIALLASGTVFGLESLVQRPAITLSLVSDGAECIFISKRLFLHLANIRVLRVVTDMIQTYPTLDYIQNQVKSYRSWQKYKKSLVKEVLNRMH